MVAISPGRRSPGASVHHVGGFLGTVEEHQAPELAPVRLLEDSHRGKVGGDTGGFGISLLLSVHPAKPGTISTAAGGSGEGGGDVGDGSGREGAAERDGSAASFECVAFVGTMRMLMWLIRRSRMSEVACMTAPMG